MPRLQVSDGRSSSWTMIVPMVPRAWYASAVSMTSVCAPFAEIGRRGLAGAVIEGMLASAGKVVAVIDGDLQHDERLLPRMLAEIEGGADLVIASRYTGAGNATGGFSKIRQRWSSARHASDEQAAQNQSQRPDERLLHDPPRRNRRHRPEALDRRLQTAARYPCIVAAGAQNFRAALYVQAAAARSFET